MNPEVIVVRAEAQALWNREEYNTQSEYTELADCIIVTCKTHGHPIFQDNLCLCSMLTSRNEEINMAAYLFVNDDDADLIELDDSASVVFMSESANEALSEGDTIDEVLEAFADQGAARVLLKDLVAAYNKLNKTKHKL